MSPTLVHAQEIPDDVVLSVGAGLLGPIVAVPVKFGIARLLGTGIRASRLLALCAVEWFLWFPFGFILVRIAGVFFGPFALLLLSVWMHWRFTSAESRTVRHVIGPVLALPAPALSVLLFLTILGA